MKRFLAALLGSLAILLLPLGQAAQTWTEGGNYELLTPPQRTSVAPGKVEVMEVFSYGCPSCNSFQPVMAALKRDLPSNVQMTLLPASFKPEEDWPMLQRAYFTAQALGIAERTHQALFDAVWKTGELAMQVPSTPCLVINGKYRIDMDKVRSQDDLLGLVRYLVDKENRHL